MAVATALAIASATFAAIQTAKSISDSKKLREAIDDAPESDVINFAEGASVSTRGVELALEA